MAEKITSKERRGIWKHKFFLEHETLNLRVLNSSPKFGVEATLKKLKLNISLKKKETGVELELKISV